MGATLLREKEGDLIAYNNELTNMEYSYSRISTFHNCPYEFYLGYIVQDDSIYLSEGNYYAEVGSYVHLILEKIFKGELKVEDAYDYYVDHFDENIFYTTYPSVMDKRYEACADYFCIVDFDWLKDYEILGVEKEVHFTVGNYRFVGFIDLLLRDKQDGKIVVLDHKSSDYPFSKRGGIKKSMVEKFEDYKRQMYLYAHAVFQEYGEYPKSLMWNHFKEIGKLADVSFDQNEYENALKWAVDTIKNIEVEEEFPAKPSKFYCNNLCNFRNSCEYREDAE